MERNVFIGFDSGKVPSPSYVIDINALKENLKILSVVEKRTGAKVLAALKGFSMYALFPLIGRYVSGVCASSPHEARLGKEEMGKEVTVYAPAYSEDDLKELLTLADHIIFNSNGLWQRFLPLVKQYEDSVSFGFRINPEHREAKVALYDPSAPFSRLGITLKHFKGLNLDGISGLHFHNLCEQNADALVRTWKVVSKGFGEYIRGMKWINLGGGHHITRPDYDIDMLCQLIERIHKEYKVAVYLEPGEAVALNAGVLVTTVLDIIENEMMIAILDTSATCHMPDVLEMPYRPLVWNAGNPGERKYTYRLAGLSCLAGDVVGDYSFDHQLVAGDRLIFQDMAHYTMVKTTTFNGVRLPSLCIFDGDAGSYKIIRQFGYSDFRGRLS